MKFANKMLVAMIIFMTTVLSAFAGDFDWLKELNIRAKSDSSGFKATLQSRFRIGNAEINTVFSNVDRPADAYMVLRLGELSHQPVDYVVKQYRTSKHKGWGVLAKNLGIKPGSREFHALKAGHDLRGEFGGDSARGGREKHGHSSGAGHGKKKNK